MAKKQGDSKLAVAGTITLGLAIAGVMLVQPPLKSTRPPSLGGELRPPVAQGAVQARLWEDPLEAALRVAAFDGTVKKANGDIKDDVDRVRPIREEIDAKIAQYPGRPVTVLLAMAEGGSSGESRETRLRDRYAIGSALGTACYVPEHDEQLSYVEWQDRAGGSRVLPYEWYGEGPKKCSLDPAWAQAVLVLWVSEDITGSHPIGALQRLTQSILCEEGTIAACRQGPDGTVLLDLKRERHARFKILGPRSSSAFRNLLEEAAGLVQGREDHLIWANAGGRVELYSPWATAMPKLLTQGIEVTAEPPASADCASSDPNRGRLCRILLRGGIELRHSIGSDDQLFEALAQELERRRVKFERDAVVLISEWDSFYGRTMPVELTAAVCHRIAHRPPEENRGIESERLALIQSNCGTLDQAVDFQMHPSGTRGLGLNLWRYSYLRGLDGEVPGGSSGDASKGAVSKSAKNALFENQVHERPIGTSQFDYAQRLAARIERDMTEEAHLQQQQREEGLSGAVNLEASGRQPPAAIGILGSDAYDAMLILQAMRERFPGAVFFTTDLDGRLVYADDYRWTRNLVIASQYGLELYRGLQRDVPPFRSSYQTSAYFAALQAVGHVRPLAVCPPAEGPSVARAGALLSPCGYRANRVSEDHWFSGVEPPRLFEVGRHGAVDLSVGEGEGGFTLHVPRVDLSNDDPQTAGRRPPSGVWYGVAGLLWMAVCVVAWAHPASNRWMRAHPGILALGALGACGLAFLVDRVLLTLVLAHHDGGEPFYWLEGVSLWPTEILRGLATVLSLVFVAKAWRDLQSNADVMGARYGFGGPAGAPRADGWRRYRSTAQWVLSPPGSGSGERVGVLWQRYRDAGSGLDRFLRLLVLVTIYAVSFVLLWKITGAEDFSGPCRGTFSCRLDLALVLASYVCAAVLNLFVFDTVLLCRRWIGALAQAAEGWPEGLTERLKLQSAEHVAAARELMKIELIAQRTEIVNRLVRYPFIVLLIMMVARNRYFDDWHFPLTMMVGWAVNVLLAMAAALLLYRAAERARNASVARLHHVVLQDLDRGTAGEPDVKLIRQVIEDIEGVSQGAFVPLWQQPVVESSFYGGLALVQYLYLN